MSSIAPPVAGIDISKTRLDVCVGPLCQQGAGRKDKGWREWSVDRRDPAAVAALAQELRSLSVALVVVEPTGGYERVVVEALQAGGLALAVVNARQVREFARASGALAKTDRLDARHLAQFAARMAPAPSAPVDPARAALAGLVRRRRQLVSQRAAEATRLRQLQETGDPAAVGAGVARHIAWLTAEIKTLEAAITQAIAADDRLARDHRLLRSMPGIGLIAAATLLADMPELGRISRRAAAALAGLAPFSRDSGTRRGQRSIWGGRGELRRTLYMGLIATLRSDNPLTRAYKHLRQRGKPHKVAATAVLRRMIVHLNAVIRDQKTVSYQTA